MADAAVEGRSAAHRFYCHACNIHFDVASDNYTCPTCSTGFIEELQESPTINPDSSMDSADAWEEEDFYDGSMIHGWLEAIEHNYRTGGGSSAGGGGGSGSTTGGRRRQRRRPPVRSTTTHLHQNISMDHFLHDLIINMSDGINWPGATNMQVLLNPGDYAWGREGIDSIVTQLLNQMDGTGPPPVSAEVINNLPMVVITKEQVNGKLQCSVCWESYQFGEQVKQLPCKHVYHEACIRPWLELHGTCPICRKLLYGSFGMAAPNATTTTNNNDPTVVHQENSTDDFNSSLGTAHTITTTPSTSTAANGSSASSSSTTNNSTASTSGTVTGVLEMLRNYFIPMDMSSPSSSSSSRSNDNPNPSYYS